MRIFLKKYIKHYKSSPNYMYVQCIEYWICIRINARARQVCVYFMLRLYFFHYWWLIMHYLYIYKYKDFVSIFCFGYYIFYYICIFKTLTTQCPFNSLFWVIFRCRLLYFSMSERVFCFSRDCKKPSRRRKRVWKNMKKIYHVSIMHILGINK